MANKLDRNEKVSLEEALQMEMLINQALIDVLVSKGIISHEELMARVQALRSGK